LQVSKGLRNISCEYEFLEGDNSINGQSLKIYYNPYKEVHYSAVSFKLNILHKMPAVAKESRKFIGSKQSTLSKRIFKSQAYLKCDLKEFISIQE